MCGIFLWNQIFKKKSWKEFVRNRKTILFCYFVISCVISENILLIPKQLLIKLCNFWQCIILPVSRLETQFIRTFMGPNSYVAPGPKASILPAREQVLWWSDIAAHYTIFPSAIWARTVEITVSCGQTKLQTVWRFNLLRLDSGPASILQIINYRCPVSTNPSCSSSHTCNGNDYQSTSSEFNIVNIVPDTALAGVLSSYEKIKDL